MIEMPMLKVEIQNLANKISGMIVMPPMECERLIKEMIEQEIASGRVEATIREEIARSYQEAIRSAFEDYSVKSAIKNKIMKMFVDEPTTSPTPGA